MAHDLTVLSAVDKHLQNSQGLLGYHKFGHNPDVGTSVETVWTGPTPAYNWPSASGPLYVSSSQSADTEQLAVQGLNENWELQQTLVTLNGQSFVQVPATNWIRVYRLKNVSSNSLVGNVYLSSTNTGSGGVPTDLTSVHGFILAGENITQQAVFSIPDGYEGFRVDTLQSVGATGASKVVDVITRMRSFGGVFLESCRTSLSSTGTSSFSTQIQFPPVIPPKTDLQMLALSTLAGADVSASFTIVLRPIT